MATDLKNSTPRMGTLKPSATHFDASIFPREPPFEVTGFEPWDFSGAGKFTEASYFSSRKSGEMMNSSPFFNLHESSEDVLTSYRTHRAPQQKEMDFFQTRLTGVLGCPRKLVKFSKWVATLIYPIYK